MELLQFNAQAFCRISGIIGQGLILIRHNAAISNSSWSAIGGSLGELQREAEKISLPMVTAHIRNYRLRLEHTDATSENLQSFLTELQSRLVDELDQRVFLAIAPDKRESYEKNQFPQSVLDAFPSATEDMVEAGKCFALSRQTACVFHLSRVVESGLRALANDVGVKLRHDWGAQLKEIEQELEKRYKTAGARTPTEQFYSETVAQLGHVKNAWRNPTMHVERRYSEEIARDIFNAVKAFMRIVATKLKESP